MTVPEDHKLSERIGSLKLYDRDSPHNKRPEFTFQNHADKQWFDIRLDQDNDGNLMLKKVRDSTWQRLKRPYPKADFSICKSALLCCAILLALELLLLFLMGTGVRYQYSTHTLRSAIWDRYEWAWLVSLTITDNILNQRKSSVVGWSLENVNPYPASWNWLTFSFCELLFMQLCWYHKWQHHTKIQIYIALF